jgi:uncharacterized protein YbjT (DUF2867 family)
LLLGPAYKDKERQEAAIRASSLDWVIVRLAMLTNGAARGRIRATTDLACVNGAKIACADVAQFVLEQLTTDTWLRQTPSSCDEGRFRTSLSTRNNWTRSTCQHR